MAKKNHSWIIILIISILLLLVACGLLYYFFIAKPTNPQSATQSISTPSEVAPTETQVKQLELATVPPEIVLADEPDINSIDFNELQKINEEIYAWIYVPNTNVDYPVAQAFLSGDDYYYLEHNIYREYQFSGTIYSEYQNKRTFQDPVTVLYGHNMINGTMFQSLHNFENKEFFDKNNTMFVFTKDKLITYLIYSCFDYDDRHILNSFHMEKPDEFMDFVNDTLKPHSIVYNVRSGVNIKDTDKLLVLSTCSNHSYNSRFLTVGVKVRERIRKQQ